MCVLPRVDKTRSRGRRRRKGKVDKRDENDAILSAHEGRTKTPFRG